MTYEQWEAEVAKALHQSQEGAITPEELFNFVYAKMVEVDCSVPKAPLDNLIVCSHHKLVVEVVPVDDFEISVYLKHLEGGTTIAELQSTVDGQAVSIMGPRRMTVFRNRG